MAMVLPVMLLFILGIIEYGACLITEHVFSNAVPRRGPCTRPSTVRPSPSTTASGTAVTYGNASTNVTNAVTSDLFGQQLNSQNISVFLSDSLGNNVGTWPGGQPGSTCAPRSPASYSS